MTDSPFPPDRRAADRIRDWFAQHYDPAVFTKWPELEADIMELLGDDHAEVARLAARVAELEAELRRVAPHLAMRGLCGYRLERP